MRKIVLGAAAIALLGLAACGPRDANGKPAPYGWPTAQNGQGAGAPGQITGPQGPGGYPPGAYPQPPAQAGYSQPGPYGPPQAYPGQAAGQGSELQVGAAPQGMRQLPSQAGFVFTTRLDGTPRASQLLEGLVQGVTPYFDGPPQILGNQTDPNDHISQVAFRATLRGQPVAGQIGVMSDGQSGGQGFLLFDSADRVAQTMPAMLQATGQGGQRY